MLNINWLCLISKRRTFCESALAKEEKKDNRRIKEALLIKAKTLTMAATGVQPTLFANPS